MPSRIPPSAGGSGPPRSDDRLWRTPGRTGADPPGAGRRHPGTGPCGRAAGGAALRLAGATRWKSPSWKRWAMPPGPPAATRRRSSTTTVPPPSCPGTPGSRGGGGKSAAPLSRVAGRAGAGRHLAAGGLCRLRGPEGPAAGGRGRGPDRRAGGGIAGFDRSSRPGGGTDGDPGRRAAGGTGRDRPDRRPRGGAAPCSTAIQPRRSPSWTARSRRTRGACRHR